MPAKIWITLSSTTIHKPGFYSDISRPMLDVKLQFSSLFASLRLSQYCKLSHMVTEEKNKYVRLRQITVQTIAELKEQLKVKENEAEIQRSLVTSKDRWAGVTVTFHCCLPVLKWLCFICFPDLSQRLTWRLITAPKWGTSYTMTSPRSGLSWHINKLIEHAVWNNVWSLKAHFYLPGCFEVSSDQSGSRWQ